jgi:hypothetical protein
MANENTNISELRFTRCIHWNTHACPHHKETVMGLSVINRSNLYVLSDETVAALNTLCGTCHGFRKKTKTSPNCS